MLGIKWDTKLRMWVVFIKSTGKVISKWETKEMAEKHRREMRLDGSEELISKRRYH